MGSSTFCVQFSIIFPHSYGHPQGRRMAGFRIDWTRIDCAFLLPVYWLFKTHKKNVRCKQGKHTDNGALRSLWCLVPRLRQEIAGVRNQTVHPPIKGWPSHLLPTCKADQRVDEPPAKLHEMLLLPVCSIKITLEGMRQGAKQQMSHTWSFRTEQAAAATDVRLITSDTPSKVYKSGLDSDFLFYRLPG